MEIMIVIVLMGIVGSIAISSFRNYIPRMRLRGARDEILSALRLTRTRAISERIVCRVSFYPDSNGYKIGKDPDGDGTFDYNQLKPLPSGISFITTYSCFEFRPDRTGAMPFSDLIITNGKNSVNFYLIPATGHIKVVE